jgi:ABC-2 type transport system permease protein
MKYWRESLAVAQRILLELWRRKRSLVFWVIFPTILLLLNGYILSERAKLSFADAVSYAAPATLVGAALFFSCLGGSVATVVAEREQQTLKRLFISPLSGTSYFLGIILAHSLIGVGQGVLVFAIAKSFGSEYKGSLLAGLLIILLSIVAYVGVGFILGTQFARRTEDVNALVATFGVPLLIMGGAFFPISLFPIKLLEIAQFNPVYHMNQALTEIWANGDPLTVSDFHIQFLSAFALFVISLGWIAYRQMIRQEKCL